MYSCFVCLLTKLDTKTLPVNLKKIYSLRVRINLGVGLPDGCWIDGTDALVEGEWIWTTNGNTITSESYQKWFPGEPNSQGTGEDCLGLLHHENYNWSDDSCETMNNFLCEARFAKGLNRK